MDTQTHSQNTKSSGSLHEAEEAAANYSGSDRVVPVDELRRIAAARPVVTALKTGFPRLDEYTGGGFRRGEMIVVSGPSKHGKSTMLLTVSRNLALQGVGTMWLSYEMPQDILFTEKYPTLTTHVPLELKAGDVGWIRSKVFEARTKYNCRAVFIDHLHFVIDMARVKNPSLEIGSIVRQLKRMAIELGVVVFLIAHIGKENKATPHITTEGDIRDSSFVPQEADSTIMVSRWFVLERAEGNRPGKVGRSDTHTKITVCNHRRTGMFDKSLVAKQQNGFLEEEPFMCVADDGMLEYDNVAERDARRSGGMVGNDDSFI